jgi:hypothetical protein
VNIKNTANVDSIFLLGAIVEDVRIRLISAKDYFIGELSIV